MNIHFNGFGQLMDFIPDALVGWLGVFLVMAIIIVIFTIMNVLSNKKSGEEPTKNEVSEQSDEGNKKKFVNPVLAWSLIGLALIVALIVCYFVFK